MQRHERSSNAEISLDDPEALRSRLMRAAVRLTEVGHRLNPQNGDKISFEDAVDYMHGVVEDINTTAKHIAARALTPEDQPLPQPVDVNLKSAS